MLPITSPIRVLCFCTTIFDMRLLVPRRCRFDSSDESALTPLRAAIQDLFDGLHKRGTVGGPGGAAPGDIPLGTHEDRPVVADLVVIASGVSS